MEAACTSETSVSAYKTVLTGLAHAALTEDHDLERLLT
jgi:hypothetical protein